MTTQQKVLFLMRELQGCEQYIKYEKLRNRYNITKLNVLNEYNSFDINSETYYTILPKLSSAVKQFIAEVEDRDYPGGSELLKHYKSRGIYKMLYHEPVVTAVHYKRPMSWIIYIMGVVAAAIAFFAIVSFLGLSGGWVIAATSLFAGSIAYISGLLYGICNDMFAARSNLPYFLLGHQPNQYTFFLSNDPNVQAIGWGVLATNVLSIIFALIFVVVVASVMAATMSPVANFILPCMLIFTPLLAIFADLIARRYFAVASANNDVPHVGYNSYQVNALEKMCPTKESKIRWHGNGLRNLFGYIAAPVVGVTGLVLTLTLTNIPVIFFSPLLSTILPLATAGIAIVMLGAMFTYFFVNRDRQIDDRYKIEDRRIYPGQSFSTYKSIKPDSLYLAEENFEPLDEEKIINGFK